MLEELCQVSMGLGAGLNALASRNIHVVVLGSSGNEHVLVEGSSSKE